VGELLARADEFIYPAAWLFPMAAANNPRLFYRAGAPRSVSELLLALS
jgi:hypothetical protein